MMVETMYDNTYDFFLGGEQQSPSSEALLFSNEIMLSDFNTDSSSSSSRSPLSNTIDNSELENDFDPAAFEKLLTELLTSDPMGSQEQSINLSYPMLETEPLTREMGTDPMEPTPTLPLIIKTNNTNSSINNPIYVIQTMTKPLTETVSNEYYELQFESSIRNNYEMEEVLHSSPSSDSPDEGSSHSPDYSQMLTNFDTLPKTGTLVLTNEEVKLIKQEGYQVPTKLPLNKTEERMLKKIRRKIKNKISAQESRRKKKEYVDALEKEIAKYVDENKALKERMAAIEKNQKSLKQERDLLRSMMNKGTPAPSTALMVFAVFFAVLFGVWSPLTSKSGIDDRSLSLENSLMTSKNSQSAFSSQQESVYSNYASDHHKSRVLLSTDEYDQYHHGPYLPSNNKYKSTFQQQTAAPGYTYSNTVEKYMNKKVKSDQIKEKRSFDDNDDDDLTQEPAYKKLRKDYHVNEQIVVLDEINDDNKSVKIIRVERTIPAIGNDTLKLAQRTANE